MKMMVFFFFKQKTAYEIRKGDWSSDVCSSDLERLVDDRGIRSLADRQRAALRWTRGGDGRAPRPRLGASGRTRVRSHHPAMRSRGPGAAARPRSARGLM